MQNCFSNATVMWNHHEITRRENLIKEIPEILLSEWQQLNKAVRMERCETPMLVPAEYLQSHINTGFNLIKTEGDRGYLRPETTIGTYEAFKERFPQTSQLRNNLPFCMWQVGCSFRDEQMPETMRATKLRLIQFYQMEFQLFASKDTKAPYLLKALTALIKYYGGTLLTVPETDLPHYSEETFDWMMNDLEIGSLSLRKDWEHGVVFEVAIGLDRLVKQQII